MAMSENKDGGARSGFLAFWTSLPGVLTGVAALVGAIATLAALFIDDAGTGSRVPGDSPASETKAVSSPGEVACLRRYFEGIPRERIAAVEAGTVALDVIAADQPKAGTVGLRFTNNDRSIGAMRFAFFPTSEIFKVESVVDERCGTIEGYSNTSRGGDKHVLQNYDTLRLGLEGAYYDLRFGGNTTIRLNFVSVVP
jgi:hypothetical protein